MGPLGLPEVANIVGGRLLGAPAPEAQVQSVAINSRRARPGSAFFALPGTSTDGHLFVAAAAANGAEVAVVRRDGAGPCSSMPLIEVEDPLAALQDLAGWWRRQLKGQVVAIVGSNGKTITKDCLAHLLSYAVEVSAGPVYASPGSYNSQLGVPLALLQCPPDASTAVFEVAVSGPGGDGPTGPHAGARPCRGHQRGHPVAQSVR